MNESLEFIEKLDLMEIFKSVQTFSSIFRDKLLSFGYSFFPEAPSDCISVVNVLKNPVEFRTILREKHTTIIAGGHGLIKDKVLRVSHTGLFDKYQIDYLIDLFKKYSYLLL